MATPHADFQAKRCSDGSGNSKTVLRVWMCGTLYYKYLSLSQPTHHSYCGMITRYTMNRCIRPSSGWRELTRALLRR